MAGPLAGHESWDIIEFFSGKGRLSTMAAKIGLTVASYEILLDKKSYKKNMKNKRNKHFPKRSYMDFNGEVGFAFLAMKYRYIVWVFSATLYTVL